MSMLRAVAFFLGSISFPYLLWICESLFQRQCLFLKNLLSYMRIGGIVPLELPVCIDP